MIFNTDDCDCGCPPGTHGMTGCLACLCRAAWADLCALPEVRATTRNDAQGEQQHKHAVVWGGIITACIVFWAVLVVLLIVALAW